MGIFGKKSQDNSIERKEGEPLQAVYFEYDAISDRKKRERRQTVRRTLAAMFFAFLFLMPTVLTFTNSFMTSSEINANYGAIFATNNSGGKIYVSEVVNLKFIPDMVSFGQYITVLFKSPEYLMKFWNSVIYVVPIVIFQLFVASLASFGFARYRGKVKQLFFFLYIVLMLMPYQVTLVPNFMVASRLGIVGTRWAIWLPGIFSPFAVYMLTKYMRRIPYSLYEAASIDGATEMIYFFKILLPVCTPIIATISMWQFVGMWNSYFDAMIYLNSASKQPLQLVLRAILIQSQPQPGMVSDMQSTAARAQLAELLKYATIIISSLPLMIMYPFFQKYFDNGIMAGAVKG